VGHGNAIVAELPDGRILLFDAGALNRAERTADVITNFLWHRGYRMIDAIVISHADADHYNAVSSLLEKIPVGQVLITSEFAGSDVFDVTSMISSLEAMSLPTNIMMDGDKIELSDVSLEFLQATTRESSRANDNADSLVCILEYSGRTICLPGDLEDYGQDELLPKLPDCNLLISPHHGSLASNNSKLTKALTPEFVFVSSRDHDNQTRLESIFTSSSLHFTCLEGALTFRIGSNGTVSAEPFRPLQNDKGGMKPAQLAIQ
jgi:competence protein ComEC